MRGKELEAAPAGRAAAAAARGGAEPAAPLCGGACPDEAVEDSSGDGGASVASGSLYGRVSDDAAGSGLAVDDGDGRVPSVCGSADVDGALSVVSVVVCDGETVQVDGDVSPVAGDLQRTGDVVGQRDDDAVTVIGRGNGDVDIREQLVELLLDVFDAGISGSVGSVGSVAVIIGSGTSGTSGSLLTVGSVASVTTVSSGDSSTSGSSVSSGDSSTSVAACASVSVGDRDILSRSDRTVGAHGASAVSSVAACASGAVDGVASVSSGTSVSSGDRSAGDAVGSGLGHIDRDASVSSAASGSAVGGGRVVRIASVSSGSAGDGAGGDAGSSGSGGDGRPSVASGSAGLAVDSVASVASGDLSAGYGDLAVGVDSRSSGSAGGSHASVASGDDAAIDVDGAGTLNSGSSVASGGTVGIASVASEDLAALRHSDGDADVHSGCAVATVAVLSSIVGTCASGDGRSVSDGDGHTVEALFVGNRRISVAVIAGSSDDSALAGVVYDLELGGTLFDTVICGTDELHAAVLVPGHGVTVEVEDDIAPVLGDLDGPDDVLLQNDVNRPIGINRDIEAVATSSDLLLEVVVGIVGSLIDDVRTSIS